MHRSATFLALALGGVMIAGPASAAGNPQAGRQDFAVCSTCHTDTKGAPARIGPNLFGVVGRKAGSWGTFSYSEALKKADFSWTEDKLAEYIDNPQKVVPGNRMPFGGEHDMQKSQDIAAYLATLE